MSSAAKASDCAKVFGPPRPMELPPLPDRPLASILISNYNYAAYLEAAVISSIEQTYDRLEVVVCDDGSTDASPEILAQLQSRDSRIKVVYQENGGQALALNAAFLKCTGDIICLLDADDVFMPDKVKRVVDACAAAPHCGLAVNRMLRVDRTRRYLGEVPLLSSLASGWMRPFLSLRAPHVLPGFPPSSGLSLHRRVAEAIFPIPADFKAYADMAIQVLAPLMTPIVAIDAPLGEYRIHGANVFAVSKFTEDGVRNLAVYERERWRVWRRYLESRLSEMPPNFCLPSANAPSLMDYAYARFRSDPRFKTAYRKVPPEYMRSLPLIYQWYWRASILLPDWLFKKSFDFVYGQTHAKMIMGRVLNAFRNNPWLRTRAADS